jgi:uncharacterized protein YqgC (DUF456 family)
MTTSSSSSGSGFWRRLALVAAAAGTAIGAALVPAAAPVLGPLAGALAGWAMLRRPGDAPPARK